MLRCGWGVSSGCRWCTGVGQLADWSERDTRTRGAGVWLASSSCEPCRLQAAPLLGDAELLLVAVRLLVETKHSGLWLGIGK